MQQCSGVIEPNFVFQIAILISVSLSLRWFFLSVSCQLVADGAHSFVSWNSVGYHFFCTFSEFPHLNSVQASALASTSVSWSNDNSDNGEGSWRERKAAKWIVGWIPFERDGGTNATSGIKLSGVRGWSTVLVWLLYSYAQATGQHANSRKHDIIILIP